MDWLDAYMTPGLTIACIGVVLVLGILLVLAMRANG